MRWQAKQEACCGWWGLKKLHSPSCGFSRAHFKPSPVTKPPTTNAAPPAMATGRPRRFDARFLLVDAEALASDPDDFSAASDELAHLQWIPLDEVRHHDLPFITEVVLAAVAARAADPAPPVSVPFFRNDDETSLFLRLRGRPMAATD